MEKLPERKVLGILSIVIGAIALILSWVPIVNNFAAVLAVIGVILGLIAFLVNRKHKKILAWIGTIISVISFAIVMGTQSMYSNAIDDAAGKTDSQVEKAQSADAKKHKTSSSQKSISSSNSNSNKTFNLGDEVTQKNGMTTKVNNVNYFDFEDEEEDGQAVAINITLTNNGKKSLEYNEFDYQLDDNGNLTDTIAYAGTDEDGNDLVTDELDSGTLRPGATVTGTVVGQGNQTDKLKLVSTAYDDTINWEINLN